MKERLKGGDISRPKRKFSVKEGKHAKSKGKGGTAENSNPETKQRKGDFQTYSESERWIDDPGTNIPIDL